MATRPTIGITGSARRIAPAWWCTRLAVWLVGGQARRISLRHVTDLKPLDGLVIGGGNDIGPEHYGGDVQAKVRLDPQRDQLEMTWINYALEHDIPLLGICRGAQLINVVLGGSLHQDIRTLRRHTSNRRGLLPTKLVRLEPQSKIADLCGKTGIRVNSLHHQAINRLGDGLKVTGRDRDEIIQAVESSDKRQILGVQWHPEYLCYLPTQLSLFRWLLKKSKSQS